MSTAKTLSPEGYLKGLPGLPVQQGWQLLGMDWAKTHPGLRVDALYMARVKEAEVVAVLQLQPARVTISIAFNL